MLSKKGALSFSRKSSVVEFFYEYFWKYLTFCDKCLSEFDARNKKK